MNEHKPASRMKTYIWDGALASYSGREWAWTVNPDGEITSPEF